MAESELACAQSSPTGSHHTDTDAKTINFIQFVVQKQHMQKTVEQFTLPHPT